MDPLDGPSRGLYAMVAAFADPVDAIAAAHKVREAGYTKIDAYSPYPVEELAEATNHHHSWLPLLVLLGGITGGISGYLLQLLTATVVYPYNIGGRPLHSWPAFIVPTFEMTILFAAGTAVFGMIALNGLPEPYHPLFNLDKFQKHASIDRFFVVIEAEDALFDREKTAAFLRSLNPESVDEVEE